MLEPSETPSRADSRAKLEEEIARYRDCEEVHDLPPIYDYWSERYVRPKLRQCGFESLAELFLSHLEGVCRARAGEPRSLVSLGAGNCDLEVDLAVQLLDAGVDNFHLTCQELNPEMVARGRERAERRGVTERLSFAVGDVADWEPEGEVAAFIANHSLHHILPLEHVFDTVRRGLASDGVFLINDMIGRNGHLRWPEARRKVEEIWQGLPDRYKYNHQLRRLERTFEDWDCSVEGNEGARAQDILPLLVERFRFSVFIAFGSVIDVFVDRSFGPNFDPRNPVDCALIDEIAQLDEEWLDEGVLTPTHLLAVARAGGEGPCRQVGRRSPGRSIRWPGHTR